MTINSEPTATDLTAAPAQVSIKTRTARSAVGIKQPLARNLVKKSDKKPTRTHQLLALLGRRQGATNAELLALTGWQSHSLRASLSGLRKQGHVLERDHDRAGQLRYRLVKPTPRADTADC